MINGPVRIVAYECSCNAVVAVGNWNAEGNIDAGIAWGQGLQFKVRDVSEMASKIAWFSKNYF